MGCSDFALFGDEGFWHLGTGDIERMRGGDVKGDVLHEVAEVVVLGDKVGFAVDLDEDADLALHVNVGGDRSFFGGAVGFLAGAGDAFFTKEFFGGGEVPTGFGEGFFAIHHSRVGFFAEFFDECGRDFGHGNFILDRTDSTNRTDQSDLFYSETAASSGARDLPRVPLASMIDSTSLPRITRIDRMASSLPAMG